jgi:hypothetical protein
VTPVHFTYDRGAGYHVTFDYDPAVVDTIKAIVPKHDRSYDPDTHTWTITSPFHADSVAARLKAFGYTVDGIVPGAFNGHRQPPRHPRRETADWASLLLDNAPPELRPRIVRALSKVLHPDTGGDTRLMQQLNDASRQMGGPR